MQLYVHLVLVVVVLVVDMSEVVEVWYNPLWLFMARCRWWWWW